jgi:hypothetical protein
MINQPNTPLPPVEDILGIPAEVGDICFYRIRAELQAGIIVGVHKKTFSVVRIPMQPNTYPTRLKSSPDPYKYFKRGLKEPKRYKKIVQKDQGVIIELAQLLASPNYYHPEMEDVISHYLTQL